MEIKGEEALQLSVVDVKRIITVFLLVCLLFPCFASCSSCRSSKKYETALSLIESGDYAKARSILKELGNYKKSQEKLKCFYFVPVKCEMLDGDENESVSLTYSENGCLEKIIYGSSVYGYEFASDVVGNLLKLTEYDDDYTYSKEFTYDEKGHKIKQVIYAEGSSRVYEWTYDENGNEIREVVTEYNGQQSIKNSSYDIYGNLILESTTDYDGIPIVNEFEYDRDGNVLRSTHTVNDVLNYLYEYTYDANGNLTKNTCSDFFGFSYSYEYFYDGGGNQIKIIYTPKNNDPQKITEITYDQNGNKTKEVQSSSVSIIYSQEWTYDENGNVTKYVYEKNDGLISSTEEYVYNENGFLIKKLYTDNQGLWESFQYIRDEDGNVVRYKRRKNGETIEDVSIQYVLVYLPYDMPEWMENYLAYFIFE